MVKRLTVTVVIPVYNEAAYITQILEALRAQTRVPDAIFVVDNNSTDETLQKVAAFSEVQIIHAKKQGNVFARNAGLAAVETDVIAKVDADSLPDSDWLEVYMKLFEEQDADGASGFIRFYDGSLRRFTSFFSNLFVFYFNSLCIRGPALFGSNYFLRRDTWEKIKDQLHNDGDIWEDMDLSIALQNHSYRIKLVSRAHIGISMRTSYADLRYTLELYKEWPRTFFRNKRYIAGAFISVLVMLLFPVTQLYKKIIQIGFTPKRDQYHH